LIKTVNDNTDRILNTVNDLNIEFKFDQKECNSITEELFRQIFAITRDRERFMTPKAILVGQRTYIYLCCNAQRSYTFVANSFKTQWVDHLTTPVGMLPVFLVPEVSNDFLQVVSEPSVMLFRLQSLKHEQKG
jgi:hypothetical protein